MGRALECEERGDADTYKNPNINIPMRTSRARLLVFSLVYVSVSVNQNGLHHLKR